MNEIRVYDENRELVWKRQVGPSEYVLFHTDAKTGRHTNAYGYRYTSHWDRTCLVFDTLAEVEAYAAQKVREVPSVACRIYGPGTGDEEPVEVVRNEEVHRIRTMPEIRRRAVWGALWTVLGVVCLVIEWWVYGWALNLGILAASKLLLIGITMLIESVCNAVSLRNHLSALNVSVPSGELAKRAT